ncbi:DUF2510 domain-containing protein [Microbacterium trichothecenolyticum]|uniref:DUF2510 domain-containing protein n=1 Tax=Microbacterium trichothecenolyticum TaxID=69370 RepID=UPI001C6EDE12|nr:DUF2510 domain-containing protein [Microbacterium trichothecenolyticum]MBW9120777.1 DUF2510 domain-containing protein [Microbacterium trichothecenolyticum]
MSAPQACAAPNWYPDPHVPGLMRWWDGTQWTSDTRPAPRPTQTTNGAAATGLVLGILAVVFAILTRLLGPLALPLALTAFIVGLLGARSAIRNYQRGRWMGTIGATLGGVTTVLMVLDLYYF